MAKILIVGASGFIGQAISNELRNRGHQIVRGVRSPKSESDYKIDFSELVKNPNNLSPIPDVDVVINAVGIIKETEKQKFSELHEKGPILFFEACYKKGIKKIIQISALGVELASTRYWSTKLATDQFLLKLSSIDVLILRPSLVVGLGGQSTSSFFKMASLPILPLPNTQNSKLRPIDISDLTLAVVNWIDSKSGSMVVDLVGADEVTLKGLLTSYRKYLMFKYPSFIFEIPVFASSLLAKLGDLVGVLDFNNETYKMLLAGSTAPTEETKKILNKEPKNISQFFDSKLSEYIRSLVIVEIMQILCRIALFFIFSITAYVSLFVFPKEESVRWLNEFGFNNQIALTLLYIFSFVDLIMGVVSLFYNRLWFWVSQMVLIAGYTIAISIKLPEFWFHPFGPILKNLAIFVLLLFLCFQSSFCEKTRE